MKRLHIIFLIPAFIILFVLIIAPLVFVFQTSFTDRGTYSFDNIQWIGLENYAELFQDDRFWNAIWITVILAFATVFFQMIFGLLYALLLQRESLFISIVRGILLVPMVLPPVIVGIMWRMFFQPTMPGINYLLSLVGIAGPDWFGQIWSSRLTIISATSWQWIPFVMLMLLAGLQTLPQSCYESAKIDGASTLQMFWYITLPLLKRVFLFVAIYRVVESLKIFPIVYTMTGGGPGISTEPVNYYIWFQAFSAYRLGYASSIVLATLVIIVLITGMMILYGKKAEVI